MNCRYGPECDKRKTCDVQNIPNMNYNFRRTFCRRKSLRNITDCDNNIGVWVFAYKDFDKLCNIKSMKIRKM